MAEYARLPALSPVFCGAFAPGPVPHRRGNLGVQYPAPLRQMGIGLPHRNINRGLLARLRPRRNSDFVMRLNRNWCYKGDALWFRGQLGLAVVQLPTAPALPDAERRLRSLAQDRQHIADVHERQPENTPTHTQPHRTAPSGQTRRGLLDVANYWLNPDTWLYYVEQNRPGVHVTYRF